MVPADFDQFKPLMTPEAFSTFTDAVDDARSNPATSKDASTARALTFVDFTEELTNTGLSMRNDPNSSSTRRSPTRSTTSCSGTPRFG